MSLLENLRLTPLALYKRRVRSKKHSICIHIRQKLLEKIALSNLRMKPTIISIFQRTTIISCIRQSLKHYLLVQQTFQSDVIHKWIKSKTLSVLTDIFISKHEKLNYINPIIKKLNENLKKKNLFRNDKQ
jgi:hypothetical protein